MTWKLTDASGRIAARVLADGRLESRLVAGLEEGVVPDAADPPTAEAVADAALAARIAADATALRSHSKLQALAAMSPAQVTAWVNANVTNLAQAQDAIATLAVSVGFLARRL